MPDELVDKLQQMKDTELIEFIRETITRLHIVADHLEIYATEKENPPNVGFEVPMPDLRAADDDTAK